MQRTATDEDLTRSLPVPLVVGCERPHNPVRKNRVISDVSIGPNACVPTKGGYECATDGVAVREKQSRRKRPGAARGQRVLKFSSVPFSFYKYDSK